MIKVRAQIILFICASMFAINIEAQISIPNKDLEGTPCQTGAGVDGNFQLLEYSNHCPLPDFFQCDSFVAVLDSFIYNPPVFYPAFPHAGQTCLMISDYSNTLKGTVSTHISCPLRKNRQYMLTYWAADFFNLETVFNKKTLQIWGNTDTCNRIEKLWESGQIDTGWHQYTAILTPMQQNYEYIHFRIGLTDSVTRILLLDAFSDIYPFNANSVTATIQDTTFNKLNNTCIELNATANITTYDSVYWQDAAGNKIAEGCNGGMVCPDSSTYYIIALRDSVPDCAGYWWSYDTVKVRVNTGTGIKENSNTAELFRVYPTLLERGNILNIISTESGIIRLMDISGKLIHQALFIRGSSKLQLIEFSPSQIVFYDVTTASGKKYNGKIFVK